ncbi:MAG: putative peptidoglycan glycosyltransferase FtsW [Firmicutes bacterium]|nr:putative peptidoglycan glycosyltransferase FtsW [Bacillota bacterium]
MDRHKPDFLLLFTVLCLLGFGLVMVYSAGMVNAVLVLNQSPSYYFTHQVISAVLGIALMFVMMRVPFTVLKKSAKGITIATIISLILVFVPGIGHSAQGVRRWIGPVSLHLQPSEFALVGVLIYLAHIYDKNASFTSRFSRGVVPPLIVVGGLFLLIIKEPDMGTGMLLLLSGLAVMFAAGIRKSHFTLLLMSLVPVVIAFILMKGYRSRRLSAFLHSGGYQIKESLIAINNGGLFGKGLGQGIQSYGFLPVPEADFIFSIIVEELGLIGAALMLGAFGFLVWRGIKIGLGLPNRFASLLAIGISCMIGIGVLINVCSATGLIPITGIPLPFISYGGTALVVKLGAMGILLSLSRYTIEPMEAARSREQLSNIRPFTAASANGVSQRRPKRKPAAASRMSTTQTRKG